jgi:hypothetical protein
MFFCDGRTSSANGAFGQHQRHDSAGARLVTAASRWGQHPCGPDVLKIEESSNPKIHQRLADLRHRLSALTWCNY